MVKKRIGEIVFILGVALMVLGFLFEGVFAGIPYQDSTPELLQKYTHYVNIGQTLYKFGYLVLFAGLMIILFQKIIKRTKKWSIILLEVIDN